ncbi:MAG: ZapG family protein [Rhodocyclaceae bacterium]
MTEQTWWVVAVVAVIVAGVIGFVVGRMTTGTKARIEELEGELERHKAQIDAYRKDVDAHFDKTASLFVSMAGSYKELFEHLSSGYETLSSGDARGLFKERVAALLIGAPRAEAVPDGVARDVAVSAASEAADARAESGSPDHGEPGESQAMAAASATAEPAQTGDAGVATDKASAPHAQPTNEGRDETGGAGEPAGASPAAGGEEVPVGTEAPSQAPRDPDAMKADGSAAVPDDPGGARPPVERADDLQADADGQSDLPPERDRQDVRRVD